MMVQRFQHFLKFYSMSERLQHLPLTSWCCYQKSQKYSSDCHSLMNQMFERKAEEFLRNLDDKLKIRKQRLEAEFQELQMRGYLVPKHIPAQVWQRYLTVPSSKTGRLQYLAVLAEREKEEEERLEASCISSAETTQYPCGLNSSSEIDLKDNLIGHSGHRAMVLCQPLVLDVGFQMKDFEQERTLRRLVECYQQNMLHKNPFNLYLTGYKDTGLKEGFLLNGLKDMWFANFVEDDFTKVFETKDIIYLSPEGTPLDYYDHDKIYVVGAYVSIAPRIDRTLARARELGVEPRCFPMAEYGMHNLRRDLGLSAVLDILLEAGLCQSWATAIYRSLVCTERPVELVTKDGTGTQEMWRERYQIFLRKVDNTKTEAMEIT